MSIRLAKLKKGCFWGFVANEDDKEDQKKKKKKKKAGQAKPEEQPKRSKDSKMEKAKVPKSALKKPKMEVDDEVVHIKPMRKAPRSTMLEKEDNANEEDRSEWGWYTTCLCSFFP